MDHDLALLPVIAGGLLAYTVHFAYVVLHRTCWSAPRHRAQFQHEGPL